MAGFSSFGKVDVVALGACVAVPVVLDADGQRQPQRDECPTDPGDAHYTSGTSFAAPIVAGVLALAESSSPLVARLALESSADEANPGGAADAKQWAHGLVDADAFVDAHDPGAPPALVLETTGGTGDDHWIGSGDGQLPHPDTAFVAYAFQADQGVDADQVDATFSGAASGTAPFEAVDGDDGTFVATFDSGPLDPGLEEELASATVDGVSVEGSVPVLVLEPDDQAPGVELVGDDDDAWQRVGTVDGNDLDDVDAVTLGRGDRLEVSIASSSPRPVAALLFDRGTEDVLGQLDLAVACGGGPIGFCGSELLQFTARDRGTYLLDLFATGSTGSYRITWTVQNAAGLPITVPVPACSPNGDGVRDRCTWTTGELGAWIVTSFVTRGESSVFEEHGTGRHDWDGGAGPGGYRLRVLYREPGTERVLLRTYLLVVDVQPPEIARAAVAPNPFEPRPHDGDRDTATFAMTSSEAGRLRVIVYRRASTTVVRAFRSGPQPAGRTDAAGNTARSGRHGVRVL